MRRISNLILISIAASALGCASLPQLPAQFVAALNTPPLELEARGPGASFDSVEAAAVDALTFCFLEARDSGDMERMRAGTIRRTGAGYTYTDIHVADPLQQRRIEYKFAPHEVARFHFYPQHSDRDVNRRAERISVRDWRSVSVVDPLHRPLYVLHPSLSIRSYRGVEGLPVEVASLRGPARDWPSLFATR